MGFSRIRVAAFVVAATLAFSACSGAATPTPTQAPTPTAAPTPTQAPTQAPTPTAQPATPTPAPATPTPAPATPTPPPATPSPSPSPVADTCPAPAPGAIPPDPNEHGSLTVLEWPGYDAADFSVDFKTQYPNASVNFELGGSDLDIYTKMAGGDQADVFHPYTGWLQFYVDQELAQPIDVSRLSNWKYVPESYRKIGQVNGQQYFIPWDIGFTSILYNTDKIPDGIDSWAALQSNKYGKHISMWDDGPAAVTVSAYIHGWDETQITDDQLAQIKDEWIAQKAYNVFNWDGEPNLQTGFRTGDVWLAYAWQGSYAVLLGEGLPVAYANPKEGRNSWVGLYGIRKDSPNTDLAYKYLDQKLAFATGQNVVNLFYYGSSNCQVMKAVTDPILLDAFGLNDPTILETTNFTPNLTDAQREAWGTMWTEVKAAAP